MYFFAANFWFITFEQIIKSYLFYQFYFPKDYELDWYCDVINDPFSQKVTQKMNILIRNWIALWAFHNQYIIFTNLFSLYVLTNFLHVTQSVHRTMTRLWTGLKNVKDDSESVVILQIITRIIEYASRAIVLHNAIFTDKTFFHLLYLHFLESIFLNCK